jgi:hypothetical protein
VKWIQCHNVVIWPAWSSPQILPIDIFENQMSKHMKLSANYPRTGWQNFFQELDNNNSSENKLEQFKLYTNKMNLIRGFDIRDHVPELNQL